MKSKQDIHLAITALTMLMFKADKPEDKKLARKGASILCWVMNYPNEFDAFMDKFKELNPLGDVTSERLDEIVQQSIAQTQQEQGEGFNE